MNRKNKWRSGIIMIMALVITSALTSCGKDDGPGIPDYRVAFSYSPTNPEAGQTVSFTDASTGGESWLWDFGDGETSTEQNPSHVYMEEGAYNVMLQIDGFEQLSAEEVVTVGKQVPVISYTPDAGIESGTEVTFSVEIYNPNSAALTYSWDFGSNATVQTSTEESPVVAFVAEGVQNVSVTVTLEGTDYSASTEVTTIAQAAKTLIFSMVSFSGGSGSIYAKKLVTGFDEPHTDLNIPTNSHPLTLRIRNNRIYVFDAGDGITFTTEPSAVDGSIYSADLDNLSDFVKHIDMTNGDGDYTRDPFFGDVTDTKIIWGDRRNGLYQIDASSANLTYTFDGVGGYFVANADLGYYSAWRTDGGPTYGWGALNGSFLVRDNNGTSEYWWAKNSNHKGLWRFQDGDIGTTDAVPALGELLATEAVRAFDLDETNSKVYFSINKPNTDNPMGFYRANFDGTGLELIDDAQFDAEGGDLERTHITGIAVDADGGYVYWGYRATATPDPDNALEASNGIKRWKIDGTPGTDDAEYYVTLTADEYVYGLAIDHRKQ